MNDAERETLERRIDELCAEVEKYRSARDASADLATKTIDRIRELEAEVERLKGKLSESLDESHALEVENLKLYNENFELQRHLEEEKQRNAKLRELLLDVWNDATEFDGFWDYVHDDGEIYNVDELPHYQERMRKLGIEAN